MRFPTALDSRLPAAWFRDLADAVRALRRNPGFVAVAAVTLGLGIGGCAAMYSFTRQLIFVDYPYPNLDSLIEVGEADKRNPGAIRGLPTDAFFQLRENGRFIEQIAGYNTDGFIAAGDEGVQILEGVLVTPNVFGLLGVPPFHGRVFSENDLGSAQGDVVVLGESAWRRDFGGSPDIVGSTVILNRTAYTVVGVMPASFWPGRDLWVPLDVSPGEAQRLRTWARLTDASARDRARAELETLSRNLAQGRGDPESMRELTLRSPFERSGGRVVVLLLIAAVPVALVFLIACVNIAHLQLGRDLQRRREMAVRLAIGAGRGRLLRQLLTESALLALLGACIGAVIASWGLDAIAAYLPATTTARLGGLTLDAEAVLFLAGLAAVSVVVIGLVPALRVSSLNLTSTLNEGARGQTSRSSFSTWLIASELACATLLLLGTGMMVLLAQHVSRVDLGFDQTNLWSARFSMRGGLANPDARRAWAARSLEQVRGLPGVSFAAISTELPFTGGERRLVETPEHTPSAVEYRAVSADYFEMLRTPVLLGRGFGSQDREGAAPVVIVNETLARQLFSSDALGKNLTVLAEDGGAARDVRRVVGVVADIRQRISGNPPAPIAYTPFRQDPMAPLSLLVRSSSDLNALGRAVLDELEAPSPDLIVLSSFAMERRVREQMLSHQFLPATMSLFALFGLVLAGVGLYGTASRAVAQRTREIGIRQALGAKASDVIRLVLSRGGQGAATGIALGAIGAWGAIKLFLSSLEPHERSAIGVDLLTRFDVAAAVFGSSALLLLIVFAATWIPAATAIRIAPAQALRHDS